MTVVTRFAPSPTGFLHIGGARTALFNWLFARRQGGKFLLRIEDTDQARSTQEAVDKIFQSLTWLGLEADEPPVFQFARAPRHREVAQQLLDQDKAYRCYCTPEILENKRAQALAEKRSPRYDRTCRALESASDAPYVVRLKMPEDGATVIEDQVQGQVCVQNDQLDDMVLLRADGTPTYMLSVVVDDHDMGITHIIRGDDHLTNAFRQIQLYRAMDWQVPHFAHIPLIHGADGSKLSKRHGALGVEAYEALGFLPEALCNYLLRLGWGHGDIELIEKEQAIALFDIADVGRGASRFDLMKLTHFNGHYIRQADDQRLVNLVWERLQAIATVDASIAQTRLLQGMPGLKERAKTLVELAENASFYVKDLECDEKATCILAEGGKAHVRAFADALASCETWTESAIEQVARDYAQQTGLKLGQVAQPLRAALTGRTVSPSVFDILHVLGREESLRRLRQAGE